jgi:hypothetical protein
LGAPQSPHPTPPGVRGLDSGRGPGFGVWGVRVGPGTTVCAPHPTCGCLGLRVQSLGFRVWGLRVKVFGLGFGVQG